MDQESKSIKLKDKLISYNLLADKKLGQHFLLDLNITRKIVRLAGNLTDQAIMEIGPGPGGLSVAILESSPKIFITIEKDKRFHPLLNDLKNDYSTQILHLFEDALKISEADILNQNGLQDCHIFSNLPYNIGTALILKWLLGPWQPISMVVMVQAEVAERMMSQPREKSYGRLSIICQILSTISPLLHVNPACFTPPPKVDSTVIKIIPNENRPSRDIIKNLEKITHLAFMQRRKMLRSSLKSLDIEDILEKLDISSQCRAEELTPAQFLEMAKLYRLKI